MNGKRGVFLFLVLTLILVMIILSFNSFNEKERLTGQIVNNMGVIADYSFEETLYDNSGNGINTKGVGVEFSEGVFGKALRFNGNSYVTLPYDSIMNTPSELSISLWIKKEASNFPNPALVSKRYWFNSGWFLGINEKTNVPVFQISDGTKYISLPFDSSIKLDKWEHLALVVKDGSFKAYINGKLVKEDYQTLPPTIISNIKPITFGKNQENDNNYFNGLIDEVKIFNRAISNEEVEDLFDDSNLNYSGSNTYKKQEESSFWESFREFFSSGN